MAVIATLRDGREQIGSGFLVQGRLVLTAAHCTYDKKTGDDPWKLRVVASDGTTVAVDRCVAARGMDLSVLCLADAPGEGGDLAGLNFARVDRTHSGVLRDCTAIGFPLFQRDPAHSARHTAELHGIVYQTNEHETGRLLMWEPVLTHLGRAPGKDGKGELSDSMWGGLSGAVVFHAGSAIGVIVEHHPRQGPSAVQLVAFDTLIKRAATDQDARQVAGILKLPPVEQLAVATAEPVKPLLGLVDVIDETNGDLPRLSDLDPYQLRTTSSDYGTQGCYGDRDPYVPRTGQEADTCLRAALEPARFVLLVGPAKVGKTRTAFEAVRATWQEAHLAAPTPARLAKLAYHPRLQATSDPLVVWLDDIDRFLDSTKSLTPAVLTALLKRPGPTVVVATLRQEARLRMCKASRELPRDTDHLLSAAVTITLRSTEEDSTEQAAAQAAYPEKPLGGAGLAERLGYARELLNKYRDSQVGSPELHFVVRTAIDWARTGLSRPIPEKDLFEIASRMLAQENPAHEVTQRKITAAIKKARKPLGSGTSAALLLTVSLSEPTEEPQIRGYRAYDYLVAADDGQTGPPRPVPEQSWREALARADNYEAFSVGMAAYERGNRPVSIRGFERTAQVGEPVAMFNLGVLLKSQDPPDLEGARLWYEQAAQAGHADAMFSLGALLWDRWDPPDLEGARVWYEQAARAGHADAMFNLGVLLLEEQDPPDLDEARVWYEKAARAGHASAMLNLGSLLWKWDPPDREGARRWWEEAARAGDTMAMYKLGVVLEYRWDPPDLGEARRWCEEAARAGHTGAMFNLGMLLEHRWDPPDVEGARVWYEQAAQAGHTDAMLNLGFLLENQELPDLDGARRWWEEAARAGHTDAMFSLGTLLWNRWDPPDLDGARRWWEKAARASHTASMTVVGMLLAKQEPPDVDGARRWWEKATEAGHTDAMIALGPVLAVEGDISKARALLQQAIQAQHSGASEYATALESDPHMYSGARAVLRARADTGDADALNFLGVLEWRAGNLDAARKAWVKSHEKDDAVAPILLRLTG